MPELTVSELESLVRYHEAGLTQYRHYISTAAQYLIKQTIQALKELIKIRGGDA